MGRGGGGGGSHRSGGGSFHYSSGGRSGRSSSSHSSSSYRSSSHSSYHHYGGGTHVYVGGSPWIPSMFIVIIMILAFIFMFAMSARESVPMSTHERDKLSASECKTINTWYRDDIDWIHDSAQLEKGLKHFYSETGVQPYLWITDNINDKPRPTDADFSNALNAMYDELFEDEGHVIVCFLESSPNDWATYYWAGDAARSVLDQEAGDILHSYFSRYYTSDMEDEEYMATVFTNTADRIMTVSKSDKEAALHVASIALMGGTVLFALFLGYKIVKKRKEQAEIDRDILNTDIQRTKDPLEDEYK